MNTKASKNNFLYSIMILGIMTFLMVIIGGITRLTGSGLSIVDWRPITGILPPLNYEQWYAIFDLYKQSPEYLSINNGMSLDEFKSIFWLEYIHRLWGRLIGFVLLVPTFIVFFKKQFIEHRINIIMLWILGAGQGLMGWYMVKSGLVNVPWVSPYRLTAHLCLALIIIAVIVKMVFKISNYHLPSIANQKSDSLWILGAVILITLTIIMGGFTAGLHAGLIYNTFPLMGDSYMPNEVFIMTPLWTNLFENASTVQFVHRNLALFTLGYIFFITWRIIKSNAEIKYKKLYKSLFFAAIIQVILGISTILSMVPVWLASIHQAWAILLFTKCLWTYFVVINPKPQDHLA